MRLVAEKPRGWFTQGVIKAIEIDATGVGGHSTKSRFMDRGNRMLHVQAGQHRQVEEAAGAGPHGFAVVRVDAARGQEDRIGSGGIGDADDGPNIPRVAGLHEDDDQTAPGEHGP